MPGKDDRIISMQFDNADFERRLQSTLQGLDKLNETIQMAGAKEGLSGISKAASGVNLSGMASSLDNISGKFSAMGAVGFSVIQKLTQGIMGMAAHAAEMAKTDILSPIIEGGKNRATSLEHARFQFQGLGMDVNKGMASALDAVKGTAYGLDEAANVAAQFGASGIQAGDEMTRSLRGISGMAAMTGRSYSEIGSIMTSIAGNGRVTTMDLMQFATRGLNVAAAYAKATGKTEGQVRAMVTAGTLNFKDFAKVMDQAFGAHATMANQTYAGSLSNLHAAMSRMGASFFSTNIEQQRNLFNALTPVIDDLTKAMAPLTNEVLKLAAAGDDKLIHFLKYVKLDVFSSAIKNMVNILAEGSNLVHTFLGIIKSAFKDIFPGSFIGDLASVTGFFAYLLKVLQPGPATIAKLKEVFTGLFATFNIVKELVIDVVLVIGSFFGAFLGPGSHGAMNVLLALANVMTRFNKEFVASGDMGAFFARLAEYAKKPGEFLQKLVDDIHNLFDTTSRSGAASEALDKVGKSLDHVSGVGNSFHVMLEHVKADLDSAWQHIVAMFAGIGKAISNGFNANQFHTALSVVNTALIGGLALLLKGFLDKGFKFDLGGGMFGQLTTGLHSVNQTMKLMQTDLKAKTLMEIAGAIAVLTASVVVLSLIKADALQSAMSALAFGFAQLVLVMVALDKIGQGVGGATKLTLLGASMTAMAGAAVTLAVAVRILSSLGMDGLAKGLGAVAVAMGILVAAAKLMEDSSVGMIAAGVAMNAMATGLVILAGAVRLFATMSWAELTKGLVGIAVSLGIIALAMNAMPIGSTLAAGLAMIPLAIGLNILAGAVKIFGTMSLSGLVKGLVGLAGGLIIIAATMHLMPLTLPITAAGLLLVAMAIGLMVPSIKMIGHMDFVSLVKGLGGLAAMLLILAVGVNAMDGAIGGAAALVVVSGALLVLTVVLKELGKLSWAELVEGLVAIAGVLVILGLGAAVLEPLIPALLGLGVALTLVGAGFALFGAGAFLVALAFTTLAAAGAAGAAALVASLVTIIKAIPQFVTALVTSLVSSATQLVKGADLLVGVIGELLIKLLNLVVKLAPDIAAAIVAIVTSALKLIRDKFPDVIQTAFDLLMSFLKALDDNLPKVVDEAAKVIVSFAKSLMDNAQKLVDSAVNLLLAFLGAISKREADIAAAGLNILVALLKGIGDNIGKVVTAAASILTSFYSSIAGAYLKIVETGAKILIALLGGLTRDLTGVATAATSIAIAFVQAMANNALRFINAAAQTLVTFLNGIATAIDTYAPQLRAAGIRIIGAIIDGLTGGLASKWKDFAKGLIDKAKSLVKDVLGFFGISSPSKVFMEIGKNLSLGLAEGIKSDATATNSAVVQAENIVKAFSDTLSAVPDSLAGMGEFNPVITPILDLTQVKATASGLSDMIPNPSITPDMSLAQARTIASTADMTKTAPAAPTETRDLKFEQNIYSPDALSTNDIYKGTKSQLALAKEELGIS